MPERHVTDPLVAELVGIYSRAHARLDATVRAGLTRGLDPERIGTPGQRRGDSTLAYRKRQREQAHAILRELDSVAGRLGAIAVGQAYRSGLVAVDATVGDALRLRGEFGRIHQRAVTTLAENMSRPLREAVATAGEHIDTVFDRADELDGALPARGGPAPGRRFIGRRINDPYRRVALDTVAEGIVSLDTRRQISTALRRRLIDEGVTDALTGFIDRRGARWPLPVYAEMVARTTTREAMTAGTVNRMREGGLDLVTISSHAHAADECTPYDGETFSMHGDTEGYPVLDVVPPFHPRCVHVLTPAAADFDRFEAELADAIADQRPAAPAPRASSTPARTAPTPQDAARAALDPELDADVNAARAAAAGATERPSAPRLTPADLPGSPFRGAAEPAIGDATAERLELQRLIASDPGPEPGLVEARWAELIAEDAANLREAQRVADAQAKAAASERRARRAALRKTLDPDLAREVLGARGVRPKAWAVEEDVEERLLSGELTPDDVEQMAYEHYEALDARRALREIEAERNLGVERRSIPCFVCGKLKAAPADVCEFCGDDPVQYGTTAQEFNAAYGYTGIGSESRKGLHYGAGGGGNAKRERAGEWNG